MSLKDLHLYTRFDADQIEDIKEIVRKAERRTRTLTLAWVIGGALIAILAVMKFY